MLHHLYLSPGMFGFGRLASYDYFTHVERALCARLRAKGEQVVIHVMHVSPTASIRRRALKLAELVASTCDRLPAAGAAPEDTLAGDLFLCAEVERDAPFVKAQHVLAVASVGGRSLEE